MSIPFPRLTAEEAAGRICHGQTVGFSGFTPAGAAKAIPQAIARRAEEEHAAGRKFQIGVLTGASTGPSLDGALAKAHAISFRTPYQSNADLRAEINRGGTRFVDMHLSMLPQMVRYGFLGPLQSGVGNIANSVLGALGRHPDIPAFEMYTEVLQDAVVPLLESGRCRFASTCSLTLSPEVMRRVTGNLPFFRPRILMRPQEISNHPEIVRRLGIVSMNTAIEVDLFGNVNSTHVMGRQMMNGIGGSGDFTRNAYLSVFSCPSTAKGGKISAIVPLATHVDHSEHSVQVVITEQGVADLRGLDPHERARLIIERCAHPDYRPQLHQYLELVKQGHSPQSLSLAFAMHRQFARSGTMAGVVWEEWR
ncbi:MAG: acetyl-CoA hydrolase/transferase C-terminal domain-containing protein [Bryobacteraceae bacterium]